VGYHNRPILQLPRPTRGLRHVITSNEGCKALASRRHEKSKAEVHKTVLSGHECKKGYLLLNDQRVKVSEEFCYLGRYEKVTSLREGKVTLNSLSGDVNRSRHANQ